MTVIIVGGPQGGPTPPKLHETAANVQRWGAELAEAEPSVGGLARAMVEFEAEVSARPVEAIVLADDSDAALAAALVGTKVLVEVLALAAARGAPSANGRVIAQLAGTYTPPA